MEISLQLGQFEFGAAKPLDNRSRDFPFSQLSMHEKALLEYNQSLSKKQRPPSSAHSSRNATARPQSAFTIEKPRLESRLQQALIKRPKTAPTAIRRPMSPLYAKPVQAAGLGDEEQHLNIPMIRELDSEMSSAVSSPRSYNSFNIPGRTDNSRSRQSVLNKYFPVDKQRSVATPKPNETIARLTTGSSVKTHKCHEIGAHTIHEKLRTTTLGPNSTIISVMGYTRPSKKTEPAHKSAWYHVPNHYTTSQKPHLNPRIYAQRKKRLMYQRSQSAPVKSRYLQDHTNAIKLIAQHESTFTY